MSQKSNIIFVCEHGAAKSILAASYFNKLANEMGLDLRAIARGTNPDPELSPQTAAGLSKDSLHPTEVAPRKLTEADLENAQRVIAFCELPAEYQTSSIEYWNDIPPVSGSYENARDAIIDHIRQFLNR
jgi:protein-tyrosine-phosphatase